MHQLISTKNCLLKKEYASLYFFFSTKLLTKFDLHIRRSLFNGLYSHPKEKKEKKSLKSSVRYPIIYYKLHRQRDVTVSNFSTQ